MQESAPDNSENLLERQFAAALKNAPEEWTPDCLPTERIFALAENSLPKAEATAAYSHVALCSRCRREYAETAELLQLARETAPQSPPTEAAPAPVAPKSVRGGWTFPSWRTLFAPGLGFALGGAAAGIALYFALAVPAARQRDRLAADVSARDAQAAQIAQEKDTRNREVATLRKDRGDAARLAEQAGRLKETNRKQNLQIALLRQSEEALAQTPLPDAFWKLPKAQTQTRGANGEAIPTPEIALVGPKDAAVSDTRPVLEFRRAAGATDYRVLLEIADANEECPAPVALAPTRWQAPTALRPGRVYQWQVTARRGEKSLRSPLAKFYVLSAADSRELAAARRKFAQNPLALGIVYAKFGLRDRAAAQFQAALKAHPNRTAAKRWLEALQTQDDSSGRQ